MTWASAIALLNKFAGLVSKAGPAFFAFLAGRNSIKSKQAKETNETLEEINKGLVDDDLRADVRDSLIVRGQDD